MTLELHDLLPMFTALNRVDARPFAYKDVWQRKILVVVSIPTTDAGGDAYVEELLARTGDLPVDDVQLIVTADAVPGIPSPGVVVADRWGEIYLIQGAREVSALPPAGELLDWVRFVQVQCPECQGETR